MEYLRCSTLTVRNRFAFGLARHGQHLACAAYPPSFRTCFPSLFPPVVRVVVFASALSRPSCPAGGAAPHRLLQLSAPPPISYSTQQDPSERKSDPTSYPFPDVDPAWTVNGNAGPLPSYGQTWPAHAVSPAGQDGTAFACLRPDVPRNASHLTNYQRPDRRELRQVDESSAVEPTVTPPGLRSQLGPLICAQCFKRFDKQYLLK